MANLTIYGLTPTGQPAPVGPGDNPVKSDLSALVPIPLQGITMPFLGTISVLTDLGSNLIPRAGTLTLFQARRGTAGGAGTTTIELEVNGTPTGDTLSWPNTDANFTLKSVVISQAVTLGDRVSFRVTAAETAASDLFAQVA